MAAWALTEKNAIMYVNGTELQWEVNVGSGNGSVPSGNKPLPEPKLTQIYGTTMPQWVTGLTHWGRATHICVSKLTIIASDNGLSPGRHQAIIRTNAGILLIRPLGTNFSEFLVEILIFSFKKMRFKVSSAKRRPFCLGLNELTGYCNIEAPYCVVNPGHPSALLLWHHEIDALSYQHRNSHCGDKTIFWPSCLHNGISCAGNMMFICWIRAQGTIFPCQWSNPEENEQIIWHLAKLRQPRVLRHLMLLLCSYVAQIQPMRGLCAISRSIGQRSRSHGGFKFFAVGAGGILVEYWSTISSSETGLRFVTWNI